MSSFALIIVGLFIAGPWLTMAAARAMARWTSRPGTLLAACRLADDPRAAFRAVSGLVLALFITTVAVVAIATQNAKNLTRFASAAEANVLTDQVSASSQGPDSSPARWHVPRLLDASERRAGRYSTVSRVTGPRSVDRPGRPARRRRLGGHDSAVRR